ncbi:hypothetical protein FE257_000072 [Aspergillus nanangensis]|uniref:FAD-binding domain-containing protein n=1 Tax=Aspergillus nanangensis TaxID=2582783 RepID=A0AAD4CYQ0_ASPNN|nr:hypothetical protein FE257_000072 [Aspergillus nanangensis]
MADSSAPIIIIGAGLVGLTLAQALKKDGFDFLIYDRDSSIDARPAGWGITMHWALPALESCLPADVFARIPSIQVNPAQGGRSHDKYRFLDLETGKDKVCLESSQHFRLNRKKFRELLSTGIDVNWGMRVTEFHATQGGVSVDFEDGSTVRGSMLLAVDGKRSRIKQLMFGDEKAQLNELPVAHIGLTIRLPLQRMKPFLDIHPILWQGTHPGTGYYIFFSMLSTPAINGSLGTKDEYYEGQFNMSWLIERNGPLPTSPKEHLACVKAAAVSGTGMFPALKQAILDIPDDTATVGIDLGDWPTQTWHREGGKVALVGDAAHTMTMYRGEAANHGIYDAARLRDELVFWRDGKQSLEQAFERYQVEVKDRTYDAVLLSRTACMECHDLDTLRKDSDIFQVSGFNARAAKPRSYL